MFTIEDAENDGKIKREVAPDMARVAATQYGELYEMFEQVCEDKGIEPKVVLSDGILKAVKDEAFAERIAQVDIDMSAIKKGDLRLEDARMLMQFSKELGLDESDDDHWLRDTVKERIQSKTQSPMAPIARQRQEESRNTDPEVQSQISNLAQQVENLSQKVGEQGEAREQSSSSGKKDVDEVFGDVDSGSDEGDVVEEEQEDVDEVVGDVFGDEETDEQGEEDSSPDLRDMDIAVEPDVQEEENDGDDVQDVDIVSSEGGVEGDE